MGIKIFASGHVFSRRVITTVKFVMLPRYCLIFGVEFFIILCVFAFEHLKLSKDVFS